MEKMIKLFNCSTSLIITGRYYPMRKSKVHFDIFKAVLSDVIVFETDATKVLLLAS